MVSGGMPEAAVSMLENQGMQAVDDILQGILDLYELDFAKYAEPREIPRIHAIGTHCHLNLPRKIESSSIRL